MNPLLIGGIPSSGSSLLMRLLSADDRLLCLPETGLFCHGRAFARRTPGIDANKLRAHAAWVDTPAKLFGAMGWKLATDVGDDPLPPLDVLRTHIGNVGARTVVEKCPENIFAFDAYLGADPTRRVIITTRNLEGVCQSLARRGFNMLEALLIWFAFGYEAWRIIASYPAQALHCRFDDLVSDPAAVIRDVRNFHQENEARRPADETRVSPRPELIIVEEMRALLDFANWNLEDTAWTHRTADTVASGHVTHLLGVQFDALVDISLFETPENGLLRPRALNSAIHEGTAITAEPGEFTKPLHGVYNSNFTRTLAEAYPPFLAGPGAALIGWTES